MYSLVHTRTKCVKDKFDLTLYLNGRSCFALPKPAAAAIYLKLSHVSFVGCVQLLRTGLSRSLLLSCATRDNGRAAGENSLPDGRVCGQLQLGTP